MNAVSSGLLWSVIFLFVLAPTSWADTGEKSKFSLGCELGSDPGKTPPPLISLCPKARYSLDGSLSSGHTPGALRASGAFYSGLHLSSLTSLHWQGEVHGRHNSESRSADRRVRYALIQVGNPAMHRFRLSLGRQGPAFGIGYDELGAFFEPLRPEKFWRGPPFGGRLTFDNLTSMIVDLSLNGQADFAGEGPAFGESKALSLRVMNDSSAWGGTRTALSLYAHGEGERRYGLGLVNTSDDGTVSQIEWVRSLSTPEGKRDPFSQLFRIQITTGIRKGRQTVFLYDDIRRDHRLGILGQKFWLHPVFYFKSAIAFRKDEGPQRQHRWLLILGVGGAV